DSLLRFLVKKEASDLHLKPMRPPLVRLRGKLLPLKGAPFRLEELESMLRGILTERQARILDEQRCVEFGYSVGGLSRFRATVFFQRGTLGAVFRRVPFEFPTIDEWGLPEVIKKFTELRQGLVLVTGPTGSGKSSTLASVLRETIGTRSVHLVTIEDPIEYILSDASGAVTQREVGSDTLTFSEALRNALRQDPDIIMVGENRDLETMSTTLTAAETGHVVMTTLHTNSAAQTVDRVIDMFPGANQRQIRHQLSQVLKAIISLQLVERQDGSGMVAAVEILRESPRISKLIKEGNISELQEEIEKSVSYYGMQTMNQSLAALVINKTITKEKALEASNNPGDLDLLLRKFFFKTAGTEHGPGEEAEMPSDADFSRIHKLMEIERLYDELQSRHDSELKERDQQIRALNGQLHEQTERRNKSAEKLQQLEEDRDRAARALEAQRAEFEAKIERMQARLRELSSDSAQPTGRGGLFRR
ncbi:MAG: PilT/PilU family type 4a pilus ATPase, partial [Acidobacteriota bacterium]|nr:PilT/PilU family type 4a pilus ATPase [Acidobacteriota bacterium]